MGEINDGDVLWIDPGIYRLPDQPDGFAFRVVHVLGWGERTLELVWVRGVQLDERTGLPVRGRTLCVPADQRRAVRTDQVTAEPPPPAPGAVGRAPVDEARHRAVDDTGMIGPPTGYQRHDFT